MPNTNDRKGFFWFLRKKSKKESVPEAYASDVGNNKASVQPSFNAPSTDAQTPVQPPSTPVTLIKKKKKLTVVSKDQKFEEEEQMGASTKFVSVKAKIRPAPTKMRQRQLVLEKEKPVDEEKVVEKKDITLETEHEDEKDGDHDDSGKSSEDAPIRLPVGEDQEGVKQLLCRNRRLEKENRALKKLFHELKTQMDEQQEQLDRNSAELYDFVRVPAFITITERNKDGSDEKPGVAERLSREPEKKESKEEKQVIEPSEPNNKDVVVDKKSPALDKPQAENKSPVVIKKTQTIIKPSADVENIDFVVNKNKQQTKADSKDGSAKKPEIKTDVNLTPVKPPVIYKKTFHMYKGKMVPRYTPIIVPTASDTKLMIKNNGAKSGEKNKKGIK